MDAFSRAAQVDGRIANEHGKRGHDFEVDKRLDAQAADFLQVGVPGDADDKNAEEQWRNDDLDEPQKNGAEELKVDRERGPVVAKLRAGQQADEDPSGQRPT